MKLRTRSFAALFSANSCDWKVETDELKFKIRNMTIEGYKGILKADYQQLYGSEVELEFIKDWIIILNWKTLQKESIHTDLYNPDKPRNLAKSVTVH